MSVITAAKYKEGHLGVHRHKFETTFLGLCRVIPIEITTGRVKLAIKAPRSIGIMRDDVVKDRNPTLFDDDAMDLAYAMVDEGVELAENSEPEDLVGNLDAVAKLCRALVLLSGRFDMDKGTL